MSLLQGTPQSFAGPGEYFTDPIHARTYPAIDPLKASLVGKRVFVVGSGAIGQAMAISYARAGAACIAIGTHCDPTLAVKKAAQDAEWKPPRVLSINIDINSTASIDNAAALIQASFEGIDILVIDSGGLEGARSTAEGNMDKWWHSWTTNLRGPYLVARAFLPMMLKGGDKTIVFVASAAAHCVHTYEASACGTSMLAQLRFAAFLAAEYGDQGVLPFCIHLGDLAMGASADSTSAEHEHKWPELFADTVVYLTKRKRIWLSGRYINCTW
ncbi:MAG: hypothetical protein LQ349_000769, partial [Xanthoria aureola]